MSEKQLAPKPPKQPNFVARRIGAAALAAGLAVVANHGLETLANRFEASNIPGHKTEYSPNKYDVKTIGQDEMPWDFVERVDPNHDPRNGLHRLEEQLSHPATQGDSVHVPKQEQ